MEHDFEVVHARFVNFRVVLKAIRNHPDAAQSHPDTTQNCLRWSGLESMQECPDIISSDRLSFVTIRYLLESSFKKPCCFNGVTK